ncbi:phosphate transport system protein [Desulfosalsimonas propionicica]|jgi:phosphate transport system protein|uniref:Phosphate-specific transport system accessory protein PhoU n=1 Tax=Desulfosalsimonas propionicica TaxID=332175 RepID=A0A7W0C891_9BACT|nr:phosphate signaling complex protein PhoU [Desulfosalsimonas propionicica]MBA2880978.1 phosphate transport system protein [Desulfosalsimonas propionicica]
MERLHFHQELEKLKITVLNMAAHCQDAYERATRAYKNRDTELAQEVIDGDKKINSIELEVDKQSLRLLALEQPMAKDLRMIIGNMKISNELERIADQAVNIAERTIFLCQHPPLEKTSAMESLIETSRQMLKQAIMSFRDMDVQTAREIRRMDDQADESTVQVLKSLIELIVADAPAIDSRRIKTRRSIQTIIISRCMERVADLSTNIGEQVIFIAEGLNIKHQELREEDPGSSQ